MTNEEYRAKIHEAFEQGDCDTCVRLCKQSEAEGVKGVLTGKTLYEYGAALLVTDKNLQAREQLERYVRANGDDPDGWLTLGHTVINHDDAKAEDCYWHAARLGSYDGKCFWATMCFSNGLQLLNRCDGSDIDTEMEFYGKVCDGINGTLECIREDPDRYEETLDSYAGLANMLRQNYVLVKGGLTSVYRVTQTTRDIFGNITDTDQYKTHFYTNTNGSLWDARASWKQQKQATNEKAKQAYARGLRVADWVDSLGKKAEAAAIRLSMLEEIAGAKPTESQKHMQAWLGLYIREQAAVEYGDKAKTWLGQWDDLLSDAYLTYYELTAEKMGKAGSLPALGIVFQDKSKIPVPAARYTELYEKGRQAQAAAPGADGQVRGAPVLAEDLPKKQKGSGIRSILTVLADSCPLRVLPTLLAGLLAALAGPKLTGFPATLCYVAAIAVLVAGIVVNRRRLSDAAEKRGLTISHAVLFWILLASPIVGLVVLAAVWFFFRTKK